MSDRIGLEFNVQRFSTAADLRARVDALLEAGYAGWLCTTGGVYATPKCPAEPLLSGELVKGASSYHLRWDDAGTFVLTETREIPGATYEWADHQFVGIRPGAPGDARGRDVVHYRAYWLAELSDADLANDRQVGPIAARFVRYHTYRQEAQ